MRERFLKNTSIFHTLILSGFALCLFAPGLSGAQDIAPPMADMAAEDPPRPDPQPPGTAPLLPSEQNAAPSLPGGGVPDFFWRR